MKKLLKFSFLMVCILSLSYCKSNNKSDENTNEETIDSVAKIGAAQGSPNETHADSMAVKEVDSIETAK